VRVSDPETLARFVLRNAPDEWPPERIEAAMQGDMPVQVNLARPVAVRIVYGTAVASEDGRIYFLDDLYGNDARLESLLRAVPARMQVGQPTTSGAARIQPVE
jgi:murein L,D-transpeptidase YcbB/YkuD